MDASTWLDGNVLEFGVPSDPALLALLTAPKRPVFCPCIAAVEKPEKVGKEPLVGGWLPILAAPKSNLLGLSPPADAFPPNPLPNREEV